MFNTLAIGMPSGFEWLIIAGIGLLLFGKRLPEVGRSLGKGIVEFKKGLKGVEDEVETASDHKTASQPLITSQNQPAQMLPAQPAAQSQFKFDPYTGKPVENSTTSSQA